MSTQAWAIYAKIRAVDEFLRSNEDAKRRFRGVHPEVSFCAWNGHRPIVPGKKTREGRRLRLDLVENWLGEGILKAPRDTYLKREVADDDMFDAIAALWTACRIFQGTAQTLPDQPPVDSASLRMEIVY